MREGWLAGSVQDLLEPADVEVADDPWNETLLTVRLYARGIASAEKSPNRTRGGRKHYVRRAGDILVGRQNFHLQCVGAVPVDLDGFVTSNAISGFRARRGVDPTFALLTLSSPRMAAKANEAMPGTGQREISNRSLLRLPIALPPLAEQRRIVDLIAAVDNAIDAAEAEAAAGQQALVSTLSSRFDFNTAGTVPIDGLLEYMLGGAWGSAPGSDEVDVWALGPSAYKNGVTTVDADLGTLRSLSSKRASARALQDGDIVLERSGGSPKQAVGRVIRMGHVTSVVVPSDFMRLLRVDQTKADPAFVFWALWCAYQAGLSRPFQKRTTSIFNLNIPDYLSGLRVRVPSVEEQREVVDLAEAGWAAADTARANAEALRTLRSNLLTVLLSGDHEIPASYDHLLNLDDEDAQGAAA